MRPLSLAIVGIDYPNKRGPARRFELEICRPGEPIELRPEPNNPHDEHAIAVFSCRGIQLGYLASERAVLIGTLRRQGHEAAAIFQALEPKVGWIRVAFDSEEPVLPAPKPHAPEPGADGFWPDPVWDDD
ncbi:HIRAN domain-containing protein [Sphingomonas sp. R86520]|uniref:HIRAN domain-containing protein n=1 Tax=Sphingomonas sp. R86520 TaxID=3093859 RepID=UPI0036D25039